MPNITKSTRQSARNSTDNSASRTQRNITMAINRNATSVGRTNSMVYRVFFPTSAEIYSFDNGSEFTIGENTTVQELIEKAGFPDFTDVMTVLYSDSNTHLYPVYLNDKSAKAIKTIWNQRPHSSHHIPMTDGGKISIAIARSFPPRVRPPRIT